MTSREFIYTMAKEAAARRAMEKQAKGRVARGISRFINLVEGGKVKSLGADAAAQAAEKRKVLTARIAAALGLTGSAATTLGTGYVAGKAGGNKIKDMRAGEEEKVASAQALDFLTQVALARRARR